MIALFVNTNFVETSMIVKLVMYAVSCYLGEFMIKLQTAYTSTVEHFVF